MGASGHLVTVDPGRHRLFVATASSCCGAPARQDSATVESDVLRWHDGGAKRFSERLIDFAGVDQSNAIKTASDVAGLVTDSIDDGSVIKVAIPASFGPSCRSALVVGFSKAGIAITPSDLVERPIAAAAGWLAHRATTTGRLPSEPVLVIDNDGGEISIAALDPATQRLLFVRPLSVGPLDNPIVVSERLRDAIATTARLCHRGDLVRNTDWATVSASIGDVVITGSGAKQSALTELIQAVLPAAHPMPDPVASSEQAVVTGLRHLDQLDGWTACWPTVVVTDGTAPTMLAGPASDRGRDVEIDRPGETPMLAFGPNGTIAVSAGRSFGSGIRLPAALSVSTLRALDDGRLLVLGKRGARPLALKVGWPCPGQHVDSVSVRSIGRRALELADAQTGRSRPEPIDHIEPELSRQS